MTFKPQSRDPSTLEEKIGVLQALDPKSLFAVMANKFKAMDAPWCQAALAMGLFDREHFGVYARSTDKSDLHRFAIKIDQLPLNALSGMQIVGDDERLLEFNLGDDMEKVLVDVQQKRMADLPHMKPLQREMWRHMAVALNRPDWIDAMGKEVAKINHYDGGVQLKDYPIIDLNFTPCRDDRDSSYFLNGQEPHATYVKPMFAAYMLSRIECMQALNRQGVDWFDPIMGMDANEASKSFTLENIHHLVEPSCTLETHRFAIERMQETFQDRSLFDQEFSSQIHEWMADGEWMRVHHLSPVWAEIGLMDSNFSNHLNLAVRHGLEGTVQALIDRKKEEAKWDLVVQPTVVRSWCKPMVENTHFTDANDKVDRSMAMVFNVALDSPNLRPLLDGQRFQDRGVAQPLGMLIEAGAHQALKTLMDHGVDLNAIPKGAERSALEHADVHKPETAAFLRALIAHQKAMDVMNGIGLSSPSPKR